MTNLVKLPTGAVRQVFTPDGKSVKDLDSFESGSNYIAAGAEKLKKDLRKEILW